MKKLWHLIEPKGKNAPQSQSQWGLKHKKKSKVSSLSALLLVMPLHSSFSLQVDFN